MRQANRFGLRSCPADISPSRTAALDANRLIDRNGFVEARIDIRKQFDPNVDPVGGDLGIHAEHSSDDQPAYGRVSVDGDVGVDSKVTVPRSLSSR